MKTMARLLRQWLITILLGLVLLGTPSVVLADVEEAVLAGGCFWCLEHDLEVLPGVISVESGYSGGHVPNPTYRQVSGEKTGHQESVRVLFDPANISYEKLLRSYWRNIDPFDAGGQFCDRGDSYRPVIFTGGDQQLLEADKSLAAAAEELGQPVDKLKVEIQPAETFWLAEDYHQDYAKLNNLKYRFYRASCGRDRRLDEAWGQASRTDKPWAKNNE
ncbi:MAG: peptide-methionine (S)-S-oxide reductase MsrA [Prochlorococcaceae cyanobacterium ETNP18_MAG_1]|nr:peptide-methionine (S)-S-oxide reductase MsrA [Prochlorococcaceae cyanobacterium ETNP18_MAG_1]